jgi:homeobox protein YOX1/YHP1
MILIDSILRFPSGHLGTANPGIHIRAPPVYPTGHSPSRGAVQAAAAPAHYQQSMAMSHASLKRNPPSFRVVPPLPYSRAPPVMSPASYETRPMFNETRDIQVADPEPTIKKKRKRANARQLEALNGMYARTAFPSTEERLQLAKDLDMSARIVQIWLAHTFVYATFLISELSTISFRFQNKRQAQRQGGRNPGDSGSSISEVSITLPPDEPPVRVHLRSGATPVAMSPGEVLHPTSRSPQGQSVTGRSGQQTPSPPRSRSRADIDSRRYWPGGPGY